MEDLLVHRQVAEDRGLMVRLQARDEAALEALYERYSGLVYTRALRLVGDRDIASDVLQDVFFRCWEGADTYDPARGHVAGWLMRITRNRAIDLLRGRRHQARLREQVFDDEQADPVAGGQADPGDGLALRQLVANAFAALPPTQRRPLEMALYDGLTQVEIAAQLGAPLGTVKSRMLSGMERLRTFLRPLLAPEGEEREHRD